MKILIVGKGASGKDTLAKSLLSRGTRKCLFHTTRPKRATEDGEYIFEEVPRDVPLLVEETYNGWNYALTKANWDLGGFAIFTPAYLRQLPKELRDESFVVYLDTPENVRKDRLSKRSDADSVERRMKADEGDFAGFEDYDLVLRDWNPLGVDHDFIAETLFNRALELIKSGSDIELVKTKLNDEWGTSRDPLPNETVESYVISRLHLKLNSCITIQENGTYLFVYMDPFSKRLRTVGNCSIDVASNSLFEGLSKTMFRKVREAQLDAAEGFMLIQTVFDSYAFGSLPKRIQEGIRGYLSKGTPAILAKI